MMPAVVNTTDLKLQRTIDATPAQLFDVWINPKQPGSPWYGAANAIVQPVAHGLFYHLVKFEGQDWAHYGRFIILTVRGGSNTPGFPAQHKDAKQLYR